MAKKTKADEIMRLHKHGVTPEEIARFMNMDKQYVKLVIGQSQGLKK